MRHYLGAPASWGHQKKKKKISSLPTRVAAIKTANGLNASLFFSTVCNGGNDAGRNRAWVQLDFQTSMQTWRRCQIICVLRKVEPQWKKKQLFSVWCEHRNRHGWINQIQTSVSLKRRRRGPRCWEMELWARRITRERARLGPGAPTSPSRAVSCIRLEPIYLFTLAQSKTPVVRRLYSPGDAIMPAMPFQ